jgi:hypothetical protein
MQHCGKNAAGMEQEGNCNPRSVFARTFREIVNAR